MNTEQKKSIYAPFIPNLECLSQELFDAAMNAGASRGKVDTINWPESYPYCPECDFKIARSSKHLVLEFKVSGMDLRATSVEDNVRSWEDSCCEFFISPDGKEYFNFEITCIGSILVAHGTGRSDREQLSNAAVGTIIRRTSLERKPYDIQGGEHSWKVTVFIPFALIGMNGENLPESVGVNFYKCGDLTAHPHFVTWNPVGTEQPDFHRPEFFGELTF